MSESVADDVIKLCFSHLRATAAGRCSLTCKRYLSSVWSDMETLESEFFESGDESPVDDVNSADEYDDELLAAPSRSSCMDVAFKQKVPLMTSLQHLELSGTDMQTLVQVVDASKLMPTLSSVIIGDLLDIRPLLLLSPQRLERLSFWVSDYYDDYEEDVEKLMEFLERKWPNLRVLELQIPSPITHVLSWLPDSAPKLERLKLSTLSMFEFFRDDEDDEIDSSEKRFGEHILSNLARLLQQPSLLTIEFEGISWQEFLTDVAPTAQLKERVSTDDFSAIELVASEWHSKCPQLFRKTIFDDKTFWYFLWNQHIGHYQVVPRNLESSLLIFAYDACFPDGTEPPIGESVSSLIRLCPPHAPEVVRALYTLFLRRVERDLETRMPVFSTAFYLLYSAILSRETNITKLLKKMLLERFPTVPSNLKPSNRLCTVCSNYVGHNRWARVYSHLLQDTEFCHAAEIDVNDTASGQLLKFVFPRKNYDANLETRIIEFFCDFTEDLLKILRLPNFDYKALRTNSDSDSHSCFLISYIFFHIDIVESEHAEECYKIILDRLVEFVNSENRHLVYKPHANSFSRFLSNFLARDATYRAKYDAIFASASDLKA